MISPSEQKPEMIRQGFHYLKVGAVGCGKTAEMFTYFRWYNCRKYRFAIARIDWKDRRDL